MADMWSWLWSTQVWILVGFHVFVISMLALDLGVFQRKAHAVSMKEAAIWTTVCVSLACLFAAGIWKFWYLWDPDAEPGVGTEKAIEFITGYLIEESLSVDNLFVFLVIFRYFAVPKHLQHRVLIWGILGAIIMRATLILIGAALLDAFHWMSYVFGAFLVYTAYKLARSVEEEIDPGKNLLLRLARRLLPVVHDYDTPRFWVRRDGRWHATPLPLVLLVVESTDVVFALDSIPAIFAVTNDRFIVYTSNIFAILGLRALFFLLANFLGMLRYLNVGLAVVLGFVGVKMLAAAWIEPALAAYGIDRKGQILLSLGVIATILGISVLASLLAGKPEPAEATLSEAPENGQAEESPSAPAAESTPRHQG
jgi:tellurite resistance protein TerC